MGRQNLSAPKGRMDFAKSLQARVKDERIDWQDVIEQAFVAVLVGSPGASPSWISTAGTRPRSSARTR